MDTTKSQSLLDIQKEYREIRKLSTSAVERGDARAAEHVLHSARAALAVNRDLHIEHIKNHSSKLLRRAKGLVEINNEAYILITAVLDQLKDLDNVGKLE